MAVQEAPTTAIASARAHAELRRVKQVVGWARKALELTDVELAHAIGVSSRSIARWREARHRPTGRNLQAAELLLDLERALETTFGSDHNAMQEWLHEPLPALRGRTPLRAIVTGHAADVLTVLANAESGVFA